MATYVLRRTLQAIPILFGVAIISFAIVQLAPGSPIDRFRNPNVRPEVLQNLIRLYGLDQPWWDQLIKWLSTFPQVWREDAWGHSLFFYRPVRDIILERIPATLLLGGTALLVTIVVAIPIGILAAVKQYSIADKIITTFATIGYAIPSFLLGIYLLVLGAGILGIFPSFGMRTGGAGGGDPLDVAWHMVLPVSSLAIQQIAGWSRYVRAKMLEVLQQDYVRTARAKGLASNRVTYKHALRNALIPVITLFGLTLPGLLSGAVITETIFSWPGLGQLGVQAVETRDYPLVLAFVMVGAFGVVVGNLLADVLYGLADPRIKY
ncbi:MAG TPA: ABC transporter permease [Candidatus Limnocylindria bacterium]|nr:ABC transporter permease [Candidatus Limnocylindria bacterium]